MKRVSVLMIFASVFLLSASYEKSQEYQEKYYYAFDEKIFLTEVPNMVILSFDEQYFSEIQLNLQRNAQISK